MEPYHYSNYTPSQCCQNCAQCRIDLLPTPEHSQAFNDHHNALWSLMFIKDHRHTHTHSLLASGCRRKKGGSLFVIFCLPFRLLLLVSTKQQLLSAVSRQRRHVWHRSLANRRLHSTRQCPAFCACHYKKAPTKHKSDFVSSSSR